MLLTLSLVALTSVATLPTIPALAPALAPAPAQDTVEFVPLYWGGRINFPEFEGAWRAVGYGFVYSFEAEGIRVFSESSAGAWNITDRDFASPEDLYIAPEQAGDTGEVGVRKWLSFHPLTAPYVIERLDALPAACLEELPWTPTRTFEAFAATMSEYYPFFEVRNFDWEGRLAYARDLVHDEMSELALFEAIASTLEGLGDGHVGFEAEIEGRDHSVEGPTVRIAERIRETVDGDPSSPWFESKIRTLRSSVFRSMYKGINERVLHGQGTEITDQYLYGFAAEGVGYISITGMGEDSDRPLEDQFASVHDHFERMLEELDGMRALVIDISLNGGGMDSFSHNIASHFADERRVAYSKGPAGHPDARHTTAIDPCPTATFTGPIFLVSSDLTASAAEIFQLCMRVQPHVKLVGTHGSMIFSDVVPKPLPNGWSLGMSIEVYSDPEGVCYEGVGVPIDIDVPIFEGEDLHTTHSDALLKVVELATKAF